MFNCLLVVDYTAPVDELEKDVGVLYQETELETIQHTDILFCQVEQSAQSAQRLTQRVHQIGQFQDMRWCYFAIPTFIFPILESILSQVIVFSDANLLVISFIQTDIVASQILIIRLYIWNLQPWNLFLEESSSWYLDHLFEEWVQSLLTFGLDIGRTQYMEEWIDVSL